jgi:LPXTG-motif cell wall-anchored protein
MGANPTQAYAVITFLAAFILIAAGCATNTNIFLIAIGLAVLVLSVFIFRKCKPWEHEEG